MSYVPEVRRPAHYKCDVCGSCAPQMRFSLTESQGREADYAVHFCSFNCLRMYCTNLVGQEPSFELNLMQGTLVMPQVPIEVAAE